MTYDELIRSIETAAREKNQEISDNAKQEAEKILINAKNEAGLILEQHLVKARRIIQIEKNRQTFLAHEDNKIFENDLLKSLFDETFETAKERIKNIRQESSYPGLFSTYLNGVMDAFFDEEVVLHIDPRDEALCQKILKDSGRSCTVILDLSSVGGLNGSSKDGIIKLYNTFESRLDNARELARIEIFAILKGG